MHLSQLLQLPQLLQLLQLLHHYSYYIVIVVFIVVVVFVVIIVIILLYTHYSSSYYSLTIIHIIYYHCHYGFLFYYSYYMGMDQNLLLSYLREEPFISQLFWGTQGTRVLTHSHTLPQFLLFLSYYTNDYYSDNDISITMILLL